MLELLGYHSEDFWLLYLDTKEYEGYRAYRTLKRQLWESDYSNAEITLESMKDSPLAKKTFISQFLELAVVMLDRDISDEDAIKRLYSSIRLSIPNFDDLKVAEYRLTYNEIYILVEISIRYARVGENEKAIKLTESMIKSREASRTSEEDRAKLFPALMFNLSNYLGQTGNTKEALKICTQAIEICREYNNLIYVPQILLNIASCYHVLGEQEHIYTTYLVRAYHAAFAIGENELGKSIKKYAEEDFDVLITDI